jgi:hypothetical protein
LGRRLHPLRRDDGRHCLRPCALSSTDEDGWTPQPHCYQK